MQQNKISENIDCELCPSFYIACVNKHLSCMNYYIYNNNYVLENKLLNLVSSNILCLERLIELGLVPNHENFVNALLYCNYKAIKIYLKLNLKYPLSSIFYGLKDIKYFIFLLNNNCEYNYSFLDAVINNYCNNKEKYIKYIKYIINNLKNKILDRQEYCIEVIRNKINNKEDRYNKLKDYNIHDYYLELIKECGEI